MRPRDRLIWLCLACGCIRLDDCALRLYAEEYGVDMERFKGQIR